ncbi:MAG: hypothetical protein ACRC48_20260 [Aeromonas veronii]
MKKIAEFGGGGNFSVTSSTYTDHWNREKPCYLLGAKLSRPILSGLRQDHIIQFISLFMNAFFALSLIPLLVGADGQ